MSQVETMRLLHQEFEQHSNEIVNDLLRETKATKDRIINEQKLARRLGVIHETCQKLLESYDDVDGLRKQELQEISGDNAIAIFYDRLKGLREYHRRFPTATAKPEPTYEVKSKVKFTTEESHGKFVDMHNLFEKFLNLPQFTRCDYITYLGKFDKFNEIPRDAKLQGDRVSAYRKYLEELYTYLKDFFERTHPLVNIARIEQIIEEEFKENWEAKTTPGWFGEPVKPKKPESQRMKRKRVEAAAAAAAAAAEDGEGGGAAMGPTEDNPYYCKACQRVFAKESVYEVHLQGRKHKRAEARLEGKAPPTALALKKELQSRALALLEEKAFRYAELLKDTIKETQKYVELKQTRTLTEIQADLEEQSDHEEEHHSDEEGGGKKAIYNPLNLPLGWDDKPIPYWLYKLHGLNIPYSCEICGNFTYWGPRNFERHFREWRHSYGMRCLGIPNTKHFMFITKMEDAKGLHDKLKKELATSGWKPEEEEEFEDNDGNVFNKKTYEDLRRQGLI